MLPDAFHDIREMVAITDAEDVQIDKLHQAINQYFLDQFVMTASIESIRQREVELKIQSNPTIESLEFRQKRIINRYSWKAPITQRYLQKRLDFLFGEGRGRVLVDVQNFSLSLHASIDDLTIFKEAESTIERLIPANLYFQIQGEYSNSYLEISGQPLILETMERFCGAFQCGGENDLC
ncbi:hypothetical protein ABH14_10080 [Brevibacillus brevis]|nr:hypothetical protein [Brevibacillus brevis]